MSIRPVLLVALAIVVLAAPAAAEVFTVTLTNGTEIQSRYRPQEASWDSSIILLLTDVGNWIAINRAEIESVESETDREGFGKVIDTHTIAIGWAPNDAPLEASEADMDPMTRLLNFLADEQANQPDYSVQQFVDPGDAGMGGLPISGLSAPASGVNNLFGGGATTFPVGARNIEGEPEIIDN